MTVRKILVWPHKGLRVKALPVEDVTSEEVMEVIEDLKDTLTAYRAQGLAATQIGESMKLLAIKKGSGNVLVIANPYILKDTGEDTDSTEGCLSFPGVTVNLKRKDTITVKGTSIYGDDVVLELEGLEAVAIQHELDHLDGVVMIDHLKRVAKDVALRRLKKIKKRMGSYA